MKYRSDSKQFTINTNPTEEEMEAVKNGLQAYNVHQPNGDLDVPAPDISLVLKNKEGDIVGGVVTSMLVGVMHLEVLWIEKSYRGRGLGRALVLEAEKCGQEKEYTATQTWTFAFQAPDFYQSIGYTILGIFDGYPDGLTEYILYKKFLPKHPTPNEHKTLNKTEFTISADASKESINTIANGLYEDFLEHANELLQKYPEIQINLVLKDHEGKVIGGFLAITVFNVLYVNQIWIDEPYRRQGYGKKLVLKAESIAKSKGVVSSLVRAYSFQSPEFFQKMGYENFGKSDGYPTPTLEYYFKKTY